MSLDLPDTGTVGYRKTAPAYVRIAGAKQELSGESPYEDLFNLKDTLISFNVSIAGEVKLTIRNPTEEVENILIERYKQVNPDKGWANEISKIQNIFYLKWGYSHADDTMLFDIDLPESSSNIHKMVLYKVKYSLSTAKERVVDIMFLSYSVAQFRASFVIPPAALGNINNKVVRTSIFETTERIADEAVAGEPLLAGTQYQVETERPATATIRGNFRRPSDIISRHLVKIAGHLLGYGVYVSLDNIGTALDSNFARLLYNVVHAKSVYPVTVLGEELPGGSGGSVLQGTAQNFGETRYATTTINQSDYEKGYSF